MSRRILVAFAFVTASLVLFVGSSCSSDPGSGGDTGWVPGSDGGGTTDGAGVDTSDDRPDVPPDGMGDTFEPDGSDDPDAGREPGPGLTEDQLTADPWYGLFRLAEEPAISGTMQEVTFSADKSVQVGVHGNTTGKWTIFDEDTVLLKELKQADGSPNRPEQIAMDADLENGWLVGLDVFLPEGPSGDPYEIRYEHLESPDIDYDAIAGQWQSKETFTNQMDRTFRIVVRVESSGSIGYGVYTGNYAEFSRGSGELVTMDNGNTYWFILPPTTGSQPQQPLAGQILRDESGNPVLYAVRGINTDGMQGPDEFETVELEPVDTLSL